MANLFNKARVDETATFIAAELMTILDRSHYDSPLSKRISEACPTYARGLTNGERIAATLRALNMVQLEIIADLTSLENDDDDDGDDDLYPVIAPVTDDHPAA
jgi:hypothetical protein